MIIKTKERERETIKSREDGLVVFDGVKSGGVLSPAFAPYFFTFHT